MSEKVKDPRAAILSDGDLCLLRALVRDIDIFDSQCERNEYTDVDEAWIRLRAARELCEGILKSYGPKRKYGVYVRLADTVYAADEDEAYDQMMDLLDTRGGMEVMGHDVLLEDDDA